MELLFLLLADPKRCWTGPEMVSALRASELVVSQAVENLHAAGLVVPEENLSVRYGPTSDEVHQLVLAARALYLKSPDAVRRHDPLSGRQHCCVCGRLQIPQGLT